MGIIQKLFVNHQKKIKARNDLCDSLITQVDTALREVDMLLSDVRAFVEPSEEDVWKKRNALVILVTVSNQESEFVTELKNRYGEELKREQWECPLCGGRLMKKIGPYGEFFGCSNYKINGCTYKRKIVKSDAEKQQ